MGLQVVGAGLGRTGTHSLKLALEQLLGGPCYHMLEIINRPDRAAAWAAVVRGGERDWAGIFEGYVAAVDWPVAAYWRELSEAFPDAVVVLSTRDPESWWASASQTIFSVLSRGAPPDDPGAVAELGMITALLEDRFTDRLGRPGGRHRRLRGPQRPGARLGTSGPTGRVAGRGRVGTAVWRARRPRPGGSLPPRQHHHRVPDLHRARRGPGRLGLTPLEVSGSGQPPGPPATRPASRAADGSSGTRSERRTVASIW